MRRNVVAAAAAALVLAVGTGASATAAPRLTDLHRVGELRTLFNSRAGEPRLILLISPT